MFYNLPIMVGNTTKNIYVQDGFYVTGTASKYHHKHIYAEFHFILDGEARFLIEGKNVDIPANSVFLIPANTLHGCVHLAEKARHSAFMLDITSSEFEMREVSHDILSEFFDEITKVNSKNDYTRILAFITLLCCDIITENQIPVNEVTDCALEISEFFSKRYGENVSVSDLARLLNLSEKQTERLVMKHTGNSFKRELLKCRITVAEYLISTADMSLAEVARQVGYSSYSGFWKIYNKYKNNGCDQ